MSLLWSGIALVLFTLFVLHVVLLKYTNPGAKELMAKIHEATTHTSEELRLKELDARLKAVEGKVYKSD